MLLSFDLKKILKEEYICSVEVLNTYSPEDRQWETLSFEFLFCFISYFLHLKYFGILLCILCIEHCKDFMD